LNTCSHSPYVPSFLTRGWACRLQLLLAFARAVILRYESPGTDDHILLSQIRDSPNSERQVPVYISPRNRVAQLYSQAVGSLFVASKVKVTLRLTVSRLLRLAGLSQLGANPIKITTSNTSPIFGVYPLLWNVR
jgi:hypothetical protein